MPAPITILLTSRFTCNYMIPDQEPGIMEIGTMPVCVNLSDILVLYVLHTRTNGNIHNHDQEIGSKYSLQRGSSITRCSDEPEYVWNELHKVNNVYIRLYYMLLAFSRSFARVEPLINYSLKL